MSPSSAADSAPPVSLPLSSQARAALLREADRILREVDALDSGLTQVANLLVPRLADVCTVDVIEEGTPVLRRASSVVADPEDAQWTEIIDRYPLPVETLAKGHDSGQAVWTKELSESFAWTPDHREAMDRLGLTSVMCTRLVSRGRPLGLLSVGLNRSERKFHDEDVEFLHELGLRVAGAVHTWNLFNAAELARQRAELAATRMQRLQNIGTLLSEAVTTVHVATVMLEQGMVALGAYRASLGLVEFESEVLRISRTVGYPSELIPLFDNVPLTRSNVMTDAVRLGEAIFLSDKHERLERYPHLADLVTSNGPGAMVALPLEAAGQRLGVLGFNLPAPHVFSDEERAFALTFARQCSQALERVRLFEAERDARRSAERAASRIARMQAMTAELAAAAEPEEVARITLDHAVAELGADFGGVFQKSGDDTELEVLSIHGVGAIAPGLRFPISQGPMISQSIREKRALWNPNRPPQAGDPVSLSAMAIIPLLLEDAEVVGVLGIGFAEEQVFDQRDREYCLTLAQQTAQALERARLLAAEREARQREASARREAEEANRLKDQFLATLSHELRTPLTVIVAWSQQVMDRKLTGASLDKAMAAIERNAKLQTRLVEDLLDVSRIVHGKLELEPKPMNLREVAHAAVQMVEKRAEKKGVSVRFEADEQELVVDGDPQRLDQVVSNLLGNAVKFTPEGGAVTVTLRREGDSARLDVKDTGAGMAPEFLPHLFDRFRQEDGTTRREHGGLGLGLSIVKHLTDLHGGTVSAESPGKGQGATFTVRLPLRK